MQNSTHPPTYDIDKQNCKHTKSYFNIHSLLHNKELIRFLSVARQQISFLQMFSKRSFWFNYLHLGLWHIMFQCLKLYSSCVGAILYYSRIHTIRSGICPCLLSSTILLRKKNVEIYHELFWKRFQAMGKQNIHFHVYLLLWEEVILLRTQFQALRALSFPFG